VNTTSDLYKLLKRQATVVATLILGRTSVLPDQCVTHTSTSGILSEFAAALKSECRTIKLLPFLCLEPSIVLVVVVRPSMPRGLAVHGSRYCTIAPPSPRPPLLATGGGASSVSLTLGAAGLMTCAKEREPPTTTTNTMPSIACSTPNRMLVPCHLELEAYPSRTSS
jgi:hypothetical protein